MTTLRVTVLQLIRDFFSLLVRARRPTPAPRGSAVSTSAAAIENYNSFLVELIVKIVASAVATRHSIVLEISAVLARPRECRESER